MNLWILQKTRFFLISPVTMNFSRISQFHGDSNDENHFRNVLIRFLIHYLVFEFCKYENHSVLCVNYISSSIAQRPSISM